MTNNDITRERRTPRTNADALRGVTRRGWYTPTTQALEEKPAPVGQTRRGSLLESLVNILVGYSINFTANLLIFPLFGWNISTRENLTLGVIYTGISLVRSYGLRRFFNHKDLKK